MDLKVELEKFLNNYEQAANKKKFDLVEPMIAKDAIFWFSDGSFNGIKEIRNAFEKTWTNLPNEIYSISNIEWLLQTEMYAVCIYSFISESHFEGKKSLFRGRGTNILVKENGKWIISHEHLSLEPK